MCRSEGALAFTGFDSTFQILHFSAFHAQSGCGALWRGLSPTLVRVGLGCAFYFSALKSLQEAAIDVSFYPNWPDGCQQSRRVCAT
jgi:hypothetical protein